MSAHQKQTEIIYGPHSVEAVCLTKKRKLIGVYTTKPYPAGFSRIQHLIPAHVPIHHVTRQQLAVMAGTQDHGGIIGVTTPFPFRSKPFSPSTHPVLLALDGLHDVRNVGAILRSAACSGTSGVLMSVKESAALSGAAHKASAGLAEGLEIYKATSLVSTLSSLLKEGYHLYVSALSKGSFVDTLPLKKPMILVVGNEATGCSKEILNLGKIITLRQAREDISYNASVAAGILLYQAQFGLSHSSSS